MAQTAMEEFISEIEKMISITAFQKWEELKTKALKKERKQMIKAVNDACMINSKKGFIPYGKDYFNQTFNQK